MLLRILPDQSIPTQKIGPLTAESDSEDYLPNATPVQPLAALAENRAEAKEDIQDTISVQVGGELAVLPDFRGMAKRRVLDQCTELGVRLQTSGSGVAVYQWPLPGTRMPSGSTCSVTFAQKYLKEPLAAPEASYTAQRTTAPPSTPARN
jgi:hypothetical protein